jgi:hypothetical protein
MYVTSILSEDIYRLNSKMPQSDYELFVDFVKQYNKENDVYCFVDKFHAGHALYFCTDFEVGKDLARLFSISKGVNENDAFSNAFGKKCELNKYVANFHTKEAAQEFLEYLYDLEFDDYKGVDKKIRNSVIYYCLYSEIGYEIAKQFEDQYLSKVLEKPMSEPPVMIHPIDQNEKIYDLKEQVVVNENNTISKIFSIFKGNSSD